MCWPNLISITLVLFGYCSGFYDKSTENQLSPDKIILKDIVHRIWQRKEDILTDAIVQFDLPGDESFENLSDIESRKNNEDCNICLVRFLFLN